jgi:hypothetical protein
LLQADPFLNGNIELIHGPSVLMPFRYNRKATPYITGKAPYIVTGASNITGRNPCNNPGRSSYQQKDPGAIAIRYFLTVKTLTSPFHNFLLALDVLIGQ